MSLSRKLARLETIVSSRAEAATSTFWTPERIEAWQAWIIRLLETMPEPRAAVAHVELTTLPAEARGPLTRHVETIAMHATMGAWDAYIRQGRPEALPEAVCAILEAHPAARSRSAHDCEDCGFETPVLRGRAFLTVCPLCGGDVRWQGFNGRRWRTMYLTWKADQATAEATGTERLAGR